MRPGEPQTSAVALHCLLWLMGRAGDVDRAELVAELQEARPTGEDVADVLAQLKADRFVDVDGDRIELSDRGWHWIAQELRERPDEELTDGLDEDERANVSALYSMLNLLHRYLEAEDMALSEFILIGKGLAPPRPPRR